MCVCISMFLLKKSVSFRKVWFSIPVFMEKVYFYLVIPKEKCNYAV